LGEYGIDSIRHGEQEQAELVAMHLDEVFRAGLAGTCIFSFTDDWFTGGHQIEDWAFGLLTRDRAPKRAFAPVQERYSRNPLPPLDRYPRVSVVVCSYNGASTLDGCLQSLARLNYPDYEVILVDDGSTDRTRQIAQQYPSVRCHHQANRGLSAARNVGMELATGEIIAYTDSDCMADEDWLYYLVSKLLQTGASAVGGPNLLPTHDGPVAACVSASPGTPAHILVDDEVAEHVPGCNMAFWADRLRAIRGFDPVYTKAGDDVDVCWRLQAQGERIVFSPSAMVWHHRRSTVRAYLKQQRGYGEAEALLKRKHPEKFRGFRSESMWAGRIYTRAGLGLNAGRPVIHYGRFATGLFQTIYSPPRVWWPLFCLSLEWWLAIFLLLGSALVFHPTIIVYPKKLVTPDQAFSTAFTDSLVLQMINPLVLLPLVMLGTTLCVSYLAAGHARPAEHQRRWWSRLLIAAMHIAQPVERGFARYKTRFQTIRVSEAMRSLRLAWEKRAGHILGRRTLELWSEQGVGREQILDGLLELARKNHWTLRADSGWTPYDVTFHGDRWCKIRLTTVTENHGGGRLLTRLRLQSRATLFYNALIFFLLYVLLLGWFADHRWELALIPIFLAIAWRLRALFRQLNRTVIAGILAVAEDLGMVVVGESLLLRKPLVLTARGAEPASHTLPDRPATPAENPLPAQPPPAPVPPAVPVPPVAAQV
jgi:glycosyltransferase involved in cell wall biosynthesis